ncbi:hypothetical protein KBD61_03075 [Patescibacteria group bacterium]|nr:hypothetical protein [Patescibacteria group bacterium]
MQRVSLKPSSWPSLPWIGIGFLVACLCITSLVLPFAFRGKYASPDETAVALVAERLASRQSPRVEESLAVAYPWLHPRSWVSQGTALVPVGFLGWPLVLSPWVALFGRSVLPWMAWVWFLSGLYPFYRLLRQRFSCHSAAVGVLIMAATPMVLLYANRALFPNPAILSAFLWSLWVLDLTKRQVRYSFLAGILMGVTAIIRPIELIWILPWWIWKLSELPRTKRYFLPFCLTALGVFILFFALNQSVYGHWWRVGYWIGDNLPLNTKMVLSDSPITIKRIFPFGIHPRAIWWNLQSFTQAFLWPFWLLLGTALASYLSTFKRNRVSYKQALSTPLLWISAWTVFSLLIVYGSGVYQDHVRPGAVTVGNSFLRYLLPLAPLIGVAVAYLFEAYRGRKEFAWLASLLVISLCGFGIYAVTLKDDEGVVATRTELIRYADIHEQALALFPKGSVIISDRSDKVFSSSFRAVSPRPSLEEIARLVHDSEAQVDVGIFARPFSQRERDDLRGLGLEVLEVGAFGRERLYRVLPR